MSEPTPYTPEWNALMDEPVVFRDHGRIRVRHTVNVPARFADVRLLTEEEFSALAPHEQDEYAPLTRRHTVYLKFFPKYTPEEVLSLSQIKTHAQ